MAKDSEIINQQQCNLSLLSGSHKSGHLRNLSPATTTNFIPTGFLQVAPEASACISVPCLCSGIFLTMEKLAIFAFLLVAKHSYPEKQSVGMAFSREWNAAVSCPPPVFVHPLLAGEAFKPSPAAGCPKVDITCTLAGSFLPFFARMPHARCCNRIPFPKNRPGTLWKCRLLSVPSRNMLKVERDSLYIHVCRVCEQDDAESGRSKPCPLTSKCPLLLRTRSANTEKRSIFITAQSKSKKALAPPQYRCMHLFVKMTSFLDCRRPTGWKKSF